MAEAETKKHYIRFGKIPENKKSLVHRGDAILGEEAGLSVWDCAYANDTPFPLLPVNPNEEAVSDYFYYLFGSKPVYLVTGTELEERGTDGEPLLADDIEIIKEVTEEYEYLKGIFNM